METGGSSLDENSLMRVMDQNDPSFKQIAFTGFTMDDLDSRVKVLQSFAEKNFPGTRVANIETPKTGPWTARKPTKVTLMEFYSRDARDVALASIKDKTLLSEKTKILRSSLIVQGLKCNKLGIRLCVRLKSWRR